MGKVLVTGAAGFIGYHLAMKLLDDGHEVVGLDNLNGYYDVTLKQSRLDRLRARAGFRFVRLGLEEREEVASLFGRERFETVVNLAAQPGVQYSLKNPQAYIDSNICGFMNVLEGCRHSGVQHLVFASSSSVYGANRAMPYSVHQNVDHPLSLYAATKKANELMAHTYANLYGLPCSGLRFFTVYGPWGRPDMAYFIFTRAILEGQPIKVFNNGNMQRDFTYVDDIVEGISRVVARIPEPDPSWRGEHPDPGSSFAPYRIYNIGNNRPVDLLTFIRTIETRLGREAVKEFLPLQAGDVLATFADVDDLMADVGFRPATPIQVGIDRFVSWYLDYYGIKTA